MQEPLRIDVRCFSHVKDVLGRDSFTLELPEGATADDVVSRIRGMGGDRLDHLPLRVAVNRTIVPGSTTLSDGDEVALIPPVQGG